MLLKSAVPPVMLVVHKHTHTHTHTQKTASMRSGPAIVCVCIWIYIHTHTHTHAHSRIHKDLYMIRMATILNTLFITILVVLRLNEYLKLPTRTLDNNSPQQNNEVTVSSENAKQPKSTKSRNSHSSVSLGTNST